MKQKTPNRRIRLQLYNEDEVKVVVNKKITDLVQEMNDLSKPQIKTRLLELKGLCSNYTFPEQPA